MREHLDNDQQSSTLEIQRNASRLRLIKTGPGLRAIMELAGKQIQLEIPEEMEGFEIVGAAIATGGSNFFPSYSMGRCLEVPPSGSGSTFSMTTARR